MQPFASRIRIMGSPGSGKTTISRALADATGLPLLALDRDLWIPAKSQKDTQQRTRRLSAAVDEFLAAHDQWIIEGNHLDWTRQTVEQATYQVVLSRPLAVRIWRCFRRWQGNPDQRRSLRSHLGQQRYTAVYNFTSLPSLIEICKSSQAPWTQCRTESEIASLLARFPGAMECYRERLQGHIRPEMEMAGVGSGVGWTSQDQPLPELAEDALVRLG